MQFTVTTTKQVELDITFPCCYEFSGLFIHFKNENQCFKISEMTKGCMKLEEDKTGNWIEYMHRNGKPCDKADFGYALKSTLDKFEEYFYPEFEETFAMVTIHDQVKVS